MFHCTCLGDEESLAANVVKQLTPEHRANWSAILGEGIPEQDCIESLFVTDFSLRENLIKHDTKYVLNNFYALR
jgi:hypothetical protein